MQKLILLLVFSICSAVSANTSGNVIVSKISTESITFGTKNTLNKLLIKSETYRDEYYFKCSKHNIYNSKGTSACYINKSQINLMQQNLGLNHGYYNCTTTEKIHTSDGLDLDCTFVPAMPVYNVNL